MCTSMCVWICASALSFPSATKRFVLYRVVQAGLTPLTFAEHRLSPLAAFTSGAYFLHNGRRWQWILHCQLYRHFWRLIVRMCLATSNTLLLVLQDAPKRIFSMNSWSGQPENNEKTLFSPTLHPLSLVIFATATVVAFVLLCNSRFNFHCCTPVSYTHLRAHETA